MRPNRNPIRPSSGGEVRAFAACRSEEYEQPGCATWRCCIRPTRRTLSSFVIGRLQRVIDVLIKDQSQMPFADDQHPVQALAAGAGDQRPVIACALDAWTGVMMICTPTAVTTAPDAAVNLASRSPIKNFRPSACCSRLISRLRACGVTHARRGRCPGQVHAPGAVLDKNSAYSRRRNTVPTWKKSAARIVLAWASRNAR